MNDDLKNFKDRNPLGAFQLIEPDVALVLFIAGLVVGWLIP